MTLRHRGHTLATILLLAATMLATPAALAEEGEQLDALGHALDNHYLDFAPFGKVELPRIFLVRDDEGRLGMQYYASTSAMMASGEWQVADPAPTEIEEATPVPGVGAPPEPDLTVLPEVVDDEEAPDYFYATLAPVTGVAIIDFSVTRHLMFAIFASIILLALFLPMGRRYRRGVGRTEAPRGILQNMLETIVLYIRDEVARPNLGAKADRHMPYLLTVFFFILVCNLLGLVPFGASATGNITVTAVLAIFTFVITQFAGTREYWAHIFWPPGVPVAIKPILIPVEFLGLFTKPFALAIRLFANMTAGKLVILNLVGLIFVVSAMFGSGVGLATAVPSVLLTLFIFILKLLVSLIQAYVFTILSALFIGMATADHGHEEEGHASIAYGTTDSDDTVSLGDNGRPSERMPVGTTAAVSTA